MTSMRKALCGLGAAVVILIALIAAGVVAPRAQKSAPGFKSVFDRMEIADHSGDVKLVGDIDGDGRLDLVLGGFPDDPLTWWRWPDLYATVIAVPHNEFTTDGALADIDGDGDLDIVTGDGSDEANLMWFGNPRPNGDAAESAAWVRHVIGVAGDWVKDVETADFDGDGRMDVAVRTPDAAMIFFQVAGGRWRQVMLHGLQLGAEGMASGDIDADGDTDLVVCGQWAANPGGSAARNSDRWQAYSIGRLDSAFKALVVDIDQDGRPDILTSSSEHTADVAWFRAQEDPTGRWIRHVIQPLVAGAHTLQAADMDNNGTMDVVVGQMHTTAERELAIHYNVDGRGTKWQRQVIDSTGLHNGVVADIDGDFDIYGANWAGNPPLRVWLNRLDPAASGRRADRWSYQQITDAHVRSFGLAFADMDGDGRTDIISGPFWYRQPARWTEPWEQVAISRDLDAVAAADIDGDGRAEVIAQRGGRDTLRYVWLKSKDGQARSFEEHFLGETPPASHELGTQGHAFVRLAPSERPVFAASSASGTFYFRIPDSPANSPWPRIRISAATSDEGIAFADIDRDGLADFVATTGEAKEIAWWRNPGDASSDWARHEVGILPEAFYPDRVAIADLDGDHHADIVVTDGNGAESGAEAHWWRQPETLSDGSWERRMITSRGSLNSLSAPDIDGDGDADLITGEHRGALRTSLWLNAGDGRFVEQVIGTGAESHLGAGAVDLDGDGDLDIVSIAWDAPHTIHVWRNESCRAPEQKQALHRPMR